MSFPVKKAITKLITLAITQFSRDYGFRKNALLYNAVMYEHGTLYIDLYRYAWHQKKVVLRRLSAKGERWPISFGGIKLRMHETLYLTNLPVTPKETSQVIELDYHEQMYGLSRIVKRNARVRLPRSMQDYSHRRLCTKMRHIFYQCHY